MLLIQINLSKENLIMENHGEEIETTVANSTLLIKFNQSLIDLELTMELDNTCQNVKKKKILHKIDFHVSFHLLLI